MPALAEANSWVWYGRMWDNSFRKHQVRGAIMSDKTDHILLTGQEAAAMLQPHMRNKSAVHWLENDRLQEPAIPFHFLQGQPYYLELDLLAFITRLLNPAARFVRIDNRLRTDNRNTPDRRKHVDRRINVEIVLSHGIERRHSGHADRRSSSVRERRTQPAIYYNPGRSG
jgi:hypothetical protein